MNNTYKIGDRLLWTIIRNIPCYVLHHEKGRIKIVDISDNFLIGEEFNRDKPYWGKYDAIPKSRVISREVFRCFQEDKEDIQSQFAEMIDKIIGKKK